jgi:SAM-dependent methyltransferase
LSATGGTRRVRARGWQLLNSAALWEALRLTLDAAFGLYRRRIATLRRWGVLDDAPSVLDIGCGIGQYARITEGRYLGVDLTERYVDHAQHRFADRPDREFRVVDATTLSGDDGDFEIVLMVDFLHHLDGASCERLLMAAARLSCRYVISLEPVIEQHNPLGRWIIDHDRGDHMRSLQAYLALFEQSPLTVVRSEELRLGPINTRATLLSVAPPD